MPYKLATDEHLDELVFTSAQLRAYPQTQSLAQDIEPLNLRCEGIAAEELRFVKALAILEAQLYRVDDDLDVLAYELAQAVLVVTGNDRSAPLYLNYFGKQRPSDLIKPVLGAELETMRSWVPSLHASPEPQLKALGVRLEQLIAEADQTVAAAAKLAQEKRDFAVIGERMAFVDAANSLRQSCYAQLVLLTEAPENAQLPRSFPDRFFRRRYQARKTVAPVRTLDTVDAEIAELEARLEAQKALRAQLEAEQQAADEAKAVEAELAELEQRAKALRARLGK
jgi:hypothetical protein